VKIEGFKTLKDDIGRIGSSYGKHQSRKCKRISAKV